MTDILLRLLQQMKGQSQGTATSHSRKGADGIDCIFQQLSKTFVPRFSTPSANVARRSDEQPLNANGPT